MLTRRSFLASTLAVPAANADSSSKIRIATSGFMWQKEIEEGIRTTTRMGFHGIEPFRSHILAHLDDPLLLKALLEEAGISLVTCSNGGPMSVNFIDPAKVRQTITDHFVFARDFITKFGCKHFKINLGSRPDGGPSREQLKTMANTLTELGKRTADVGLRLAPHPHIWSPLERSEEVEAILSETDPRYVGMVADTAHLTLGGMDPIKVINDHYDRIAALHFKDTESAYLGYTGPTPTKELHNKVMLYKNLGAGGVDFPAILKILRQRGYDGWITLDLDPPRPGAGTIEENLEINKRYLREKLSIEL